MMRSFVSGYRRRGLGSIIEQISGQKNNFQCWRHCCYNVSVGNNFNSNHFLLRQKIREQSTTIQLSSFSSSSSSSQGDELYAKAMEIMERANQLEKEIEEEKSKQMFEAWEASQQANDSPKTQGVKVVKTIVKQTRKSHGMNDDDDGKIGKRKRKGKKEESTSISLSSENDIDILRKEGMELLEKVAREYEHPMALVQFGNVLLERASKSTLLVDEKEATVREAMDLFERSGKAGSRIGWYNLGQILWTGYPVYDEDEDENESSDGDENENENHLIEKIIDPDLSNAMEAFMKAIDLGDTDAMYLVGVYRMTSIGGQESVASGLKLVEHAATNGHDGAKYYLALLHLNGEPNAGIVPCTEEEFVQRLDDAVEAGSLDAKFTRAHSYYHGTEGYEQSYQHALDDFLSAAYDGHAHAAVSAGAMLHNGIGNVIKKDQRAAFELYQLAGELGSREGWQNVVACYTTGEGVPQSLEIAKYITETMLIKKNK